MPVSCVLADCPVTCPAPSSSLLLLGLVVSRRGTNSLQNTFFEGGCEGIQTKYRDHSEQYGHRYLDTRLHRSILFVPQLHESVQEFATSKTHLAQHWSNKRDSGMPNAHALRVQSCPPCRRKQGADRSKLSAEGDRSDLPPQFHSPADRRHAVKGCSAPHADARQSLELLSPA